MWKQQFKPEVFQEPRDSGSVDSRRCTTVCILVLGLTVFLFGFMAKDNPLIGEWECSAELTMEHMDTAHLSDMEKQFYYRYFDSISLEVTQDKMTSEIMGQKDSEIYELVEKKEGAVLVYYPEEDEQDEFELLGDNQIRWTMESDEGDLMHVVFEKQ